VPPKENCSKEPVQPAEKQTKKTHGDAPVDEAMAAQRGEERGTTAPEASAPTHVGSSPQSDSSPKWKLCEQLCAVTLVLSLLVLGGLATINCVDSAIMGGISEIAVPIITKLLLMVCILVRIGIIGVAVVLSLLALGGLATINWVYSGILCVYSAILCVDSAILGAIGEIAVPIIAKPLLMLCILVGIGTTCWEPLDRCAALHRIWFVSVAGSLLSKLLSKRPPQPRQKGAGNARGHRKRRLRVATMRTTKVIGLALCVLCLILAVDLRPVDVGSTRGVLDAAVGRVLDSDVGFSIGRALRLDIGEFAPT
jgi:hypothetical protein